VRALVAGLAAVSLLGCAAPGQRSAPGEARLQVMAAERAFAKTMSDRDHRAFATFVADDTVFFSGPKPLHGKQAVVAYWARYYQDARPPFSWEPEEVEVLDSGTLAISSGPVRDPRGKVFARFTSIWRLEGPGQWRVVFDKGAPECDCAKAGP
jgi:ketosteroid isomerase-like protein